MLLKKIIIAAAMVLAVPYFAAAQVSSREKFNQAITAIQTNYVDSLSDETLVDAAIKGMFNSLDPHSKYFSRKEAQAMKTMMSGSFVGIGIQYIMQNDSVYITDVLPDGPAKKAGLMPGDRILKIDDSILTGSQVSYVDIMNKIRGTKNTPVKIQIYRTASNKTLTFDLTRGPVADHSVRAAYMLDKRIGYIAIGIFSETTQPEIEDALKSLKKQGMEQLILDLEGNGGGYVQAALGVADEFLKKDQMVYYTVDRDKGRDYYYASASGTSWTGKLVVLTDQGTASASELLAGALQDWDRAVIVGRRTFGKGLTQRPVALPDGSILELTGGRLYTPAGRSVQKPYKGVDYNADIPNRYASGELFSGKPVSHPDSLKSFTLIKKRKVYSGSGITPDQLVPLDTLQGAAWLKALAAAGYVNRSAWEAVDTRREELKAQYPDFNSFNGGYKMPKNKINEIARSAEKKGIKFPAYNQKRLLDLLALEIKADIAEQLYSGHEYYLRVINQENTSIQEAIKILENDQQYTAYLNSPNETTNNVK